ncbi:MAG: autotransporter domain-containing protein [Desulfobaccales bacterium]
MNLITTRNQGRRGLLYLLAAALVLMVVLSPGRARAADLNVDTTLADSPYLIPPSASFTNENVGTSAGGEIIQSGSTNTVANTLTLGVPAAVTGVYDLSAGTLSVGTGATQGEIVGESGSGTFTQSGGTNTMSDFLIVGDLAGATGTYSLSAGSLSVGGDADVGFASGSSGTFTQSGGTASVVDVLTVGVSGSGTYTQTGGTNMLGSLYMGDFTSTASGSYSLSAGSLSASNQEIIGGEGSGTFTQTGGTNSANLFVVASGATSSGAYSLGPGASLSATGTLGIEEIGSLGTGTFTQTGGTNMVANQLYMGYSTGSSGTYNQSGGSLSVNGSEYIGESGTGVFTQSGGTNSTPDLTLGDQTGASGTYTLSGTGSLAAGSEYVGNNGSGSFTQSGGTNSVTDTLALGYGSGSSGTYTLGPAGSLSVTSFEDIGYSGSGAFTQTGGTNTVTDSLYLGYNTGASGTYTLSGTGSLSSGSEYVGYNGSGSFTQSGGTNSVTDTLALGYGSGRGTYNLTGGSLSVTSFEDIGYSGSGAFTQSGGTNSVPGTLYLGYSTGSTGTYTLSGTGSLSVTGAGGEIIGNSGTGAFIQNGGTNTLSIGSLFVGGASGTTDTYALSGGNLMVGGEELIGAAGSGAFTQSGGTNMVASFITLGGAGGGSYNLSAGSLSVGTDEVVGNFLGVGVFTQSGGTNSVTGNLFVGQSPSGSGTYNLSDGSLSVLGNETIGDPGVGVFNQSGGINNAPGVLSLGSSAGASGTYNLSGGLLMGGLELIGDSGTGAFNQSGGTNSLAFNLNLANSTAGSSGTYNLSGGSLAAAGETVGFAGTGIFNQSGGTNTITFGLAVGNNTGASGTYNMSGGSLSVGTDELIGALSGGSGTFFQTGGANTVVGNLLVGAFAGNGTYALLGGTGTVGGNYTQGANGTLATGISSAVNFEKLLVTGNASLNGTMDPVLQGGYLPAIGTLFHGVITTGTGVTGTFSTVTNPITAVLFWQPVYTPTTFDLLVKDNFAGPGLDLTHNQANVGNLLNAVQGSATGDLANVLNAIADLPNNAAIANAYQQISPDKAAALSTLAFASANLQKSTLSRRITDLRFGPEDASLASGGLGSSILSYAQGGGLMVASNASSLSGLLSGQNNPSALEKPWGVYFDPGLIIGNQNSSADQTGFNFAMGGFTAGADYRVWQDLLLGLNTGYTYTGAGFNGSGGYVHGNTWPINAYAAYLPKPFYAYGSLGYALNLYNLQRDLDFGSLSRAANSSTTGNQLNAYGETGYDIKVNQVVLTPAVTLSFSKLWIGGFTESGAGALDLTIGPQNAQSLQTGVGGKIAVPLQRETVTWTPQVYAFYQHEFSDSSRTIDARLSQTGTAFSYLTNDFSGQPHRNFAVVGADVTIATKNNLKVQLDYNAEVGRGNYTAHYVSAGLRWEF